MGADPQADRAGALKAFSYKPAAGPPRKKSPKPDSNSDAGKCASRSALSDDPALLSGFGSLGYRFATILAVVAVECSGTCPQNDAVKRNSSSLSRKRGATDND